MLDDQQLLRRYAGEGSETAFGQLVARYLNLVYSAALRRTGGNIQLAQDVSQLVFTDLARKARSLPQDVVLAGWLHRATRFAAGQLLRAEHRRQLREQEVAAMHALDSAPAPDWEQTRPLLDAALDRLKPADRDALLLRFFEQRTLGEVGRALGCNEDAARKRVSRALEKLRAELVRRGVATSGAVLATALTAHAVQVAPPALAASITSASLAGAAAANGSVFTLLNLMTLTHIKTALLGTCVVAGLSLATSLLRQRHRLTEGRDNDFNIFNQKEIADTVNSISEVITLLLGSIAGISLLVGGIGIMNIMLVSVTERTREIGIRIAVGAQPGDIRLQFLIEAITLSLLGGLIGVLCGIGASHVVGMVADFKAIVSTGSILLAFGVSSVIGIFFGFYPAHKAAALNPIVALRYE